MRAEGGPHVQGLRGARTAAAGASARALTRCRAWVMGGPLHALWCECQACSLTVNACMRTCAMGCQSLGGGRCTYCKQGSGTPRHATPNPPPPPPGGELLDAVLDKGHYSEADARSCFLQIIKAVQYLHSRWAVPPRRLPALPHPMCTLCSAPLEAPSWGAVLFTAEIHSRIAAPHGMWHAALGRAALAPPDQAACELQRLASCGLPCRGIVHRDLKLENLLLVHKKDISHIKIAGALRPPPSAVLSCTPARLPQLCMFSSMPAARRRCAVPLPLPLLGAGWQAWTGQDASLRGLRHAATALSSRLPAPAPAQPWAAAHAATKPCPRLACRLQTLGWLGGTPGPLPSPPSVARPSMWRPKSSRQAWAVGQLLARVCDSVRVRG